MKRISRLLPIIIIILLLLIFFSLGWHKYLTYQQLQTHYQTLQQWKTNNFLLTSIIYVISYIIAVTISLPGATLLTLLGGFLFGIIIGVIYVALAATIGATLLFLAVKTAFGEWLTQKAHGWVKAVTMGFQLNAFSYLLFLRLVPLFPFWVVNILPALFNMRLRSYVIGTFIGILPGTTVYIALGNGLGVILSKQETPNLSIIFEPHILLPLLGLGILALLPIIFKRRQHKELNHD